MEPRKITFTFNSSITAPDPTTGEWNAAENHELVRPLRAEIMKTDGMTKPPVIERYMMSAYYFPHVTTRETVIRDVQRAVRAIASDETLALFPLRGDTVPTAIPEDPSYLKRVTAGFGTDLVAYTKDEDLWRQIESEVGEKLCAKDGVRDYGVGLREVAVTVDTRTASVTMIKNHIHSVLTNLVETEGSQFFPFAENRKSFQLTFAVSDSN